MAIVQIAVEELEVWPGRSMARPSCAVQGITLSSRQWTVARQAYLLLTLLQTTSRSASPPVHPPEQALHGVQPLQRLPKPLVHEAHAREDERVLLAELNPERKHANAV